MAIFSTRLALALVLVTAAPFAAKAQLIDPNNRCVYQPGSRSCEPIRAPVVPHLDQPLYEAFSGLAYRSGIDLADHSSYTRDYVEERARFYCSLLGQGEMMKIVREVSFMKKDDARLEVAIMRAGTASLCPSLWAQEQQLEATIVR